MLSASRFQRIHESLTVSATKVYEVVPIAEAWTPEQVTSELRRTGKHMSRDIVHGCLASLCRSGLVKEPKPNTYCRAPVRPVAERPNTNPAQLEIDTVSATKTKHQPQPPEPQTQAESPLDLMAQASHQARKLAGQLNELAEEIDNAALSFQETLARFEADAEKLNQLKRLFKD